ncbi:hypothetical protein [Deinococcus saxicola]|uniref:hypothetical protein n=1 Tax=Deinococcus saxicola TaxID=249406 RepID=UPI0039F07D36
MPGPRRLDPAVFGTPQMPLGWQDAVGVPTEQRVKNEAGTAWTMTAGPTAHSDLASSVTGSATFTVSDITAVDGDSTLDRINFVAEFSGPEQGGKRDQYRVVVNKAIARGPHHPYFGGVATNTYLHGSTGLGTMLQPRQFVYGAFWGVGQLYRNGQRVADDQVVHVMITQRVRTSMADGYRLAFTDQLEALKGMGRQMHVILAPMEVTPSGAVPRPVPTNFKLPNGQTQPFLHIMYDAVTDVRGGLSGK